MASRQEVLNVILAQLLQERGLVAAPEEILRQPPKERRLPDVLIDFQGLRLVIEAEFGIQKRELAWDKARHRVEEAIAHIGVAVVYPARLKRVAFARLRPELQHCELDYAVFTEANEPSTQMLLFKEEAGSKIKPTFSRGNIDELGNAICRSYEQLVKDETLDKAVLLLETIINGFMASLEGQPATTERLARSLGIEELPKNNPRARRAVNRIAALILANAMIFQEVLSRGDKRVFPLQHFRGSRTLISSMADHWGFILKKINYYPIFKTAFDLIRCVSADKAVIQTYGKLLETALDIVGCRASLRHDLAGRIYHRLLEEAKYLGAYYTSIPAATLLLKLAIQSDSNGVKFSHGGRVPDLLIADLACGTGTLLMAAADALMDGYVRECAEAGSKPKLNDFHAFLVEKVIYGYDVLPSAIHLTASTLALRVPEMPVNVTHLYSMPLGGEGLHLGTLDLLEEDAVGGTLFGRSEQITGKGRRARIMVAIPPLDVCVMNPPFTRSVGGNLLFGNLSEEEREPMQNRLQRIVRRRHVQANITAGLGTVFVALADRYIKPCGTIALVLPRALVSGVAWKSTRDLLSEKYELEYMITSHEPEHWNFSENTNLSEVLIVARKKAPHRDNAGKKTTFVNLWRQPRNAVEALGVASSVISQTNIKHGGGENKIGIQLGQEKIGEGIICDSRSVLPETWGTFCAFAQADLILALRGLQANKLHLPTFVKPVSLPLCDVKQLGNLGFDCRDIHDGFSLASGRTAYPAMWGHNATEVKTLQQNPNAWLDALERPRKGRHLREADHLWGKSSRLLLAERLRLNTMRLGAILVSEPVLANVWWPLCFESEMANIEAVQKSITLWLNSSLGIFLLLGSRVETEGAWIKLKKPLLENLSILDVRMLEERKLQELSNAFDNLAMHELKPFSEIGTDSTRARIDEVITSVLDLPDISILRTLLSREPILCLTTTGIQESGG
jgi:hypothetical protein